jgi:hypothetical protein
MPVLPAQVHAPVLRLEAEGIALGIPGPETRPMVRMSALACGMGAGSGLVAMFPQALPGRSMRGPGSEIFEKILVMPRDLQLGFVLSEYVGTQEVWNTHRAEAKELTGIDISGVGNVAIEGPAAMVYGPGQSQTYLARVPRDGDPTIQSSTLWVFSGEAGTDQTATGLRIKVFPHRPDWSEPWRESISYLTEILSAYDRSEQRRALRRVPRYGASYRVLTTSMAETAALENLLYGWQAKPWGVPWWPETCLLSADVAPGALALPVETSERPSFGEGGLVMVWSDYATWEAFNVVSVTGGMLGLASQTTRAWKAGARVVPLRRGRLGDGGLGRPANWLSSGTFTFTCEAL